MPWATHQGSTRSRRSSPRGLDRRVRRPRLTAYLVHRWTWTASSAPRPGCGWTRSAPAIQPIRSGRSESQVKFTRSLGKGVRYRSAGQGRDHGRQARGGWHGERRRQVAVIGTTHDLLEVQHIRMARGRFLPVAEVSRGRPVVVLTRSSVCEPSRFGSQRRGAKCVNPGALRWMARSRNSRQRLRKPSGTTCEHALVGGASSESRLLR